MAPKPTPGAGSTAAKEKKKPRGAERRKRYPAAMKRKAIDMMERGVDRKEVERECYKQFKIEVADSTLSDWWVGRERLKQKLPADGDLHPRWPKLDEKLLPLLQPLDERGVPTLETIRKKVHRALRPTDKDLTSVLILL